MTRSLFAVPLFLLATGSAPAQFVGANGVGVFSYRSAFVSGSNPIVGNVTTGYFMAGGLGGWGLNGGGGYNAGGYMSGMSAGIEGSQKQLDLAKVQKQGKAYTQPAPARAAIADQWNYERGATGFAPTPAAKPLPLPEFVTRASAADVASGDALNTLLDRIRPLDAPAKKAADGQLVSPNLLARLEFQGGPTADALNLVRDGRIPFPRTLLGPQFDPVRKDVAAEFALLLEVLGQSPSVVTSAANRLGTAVKRARVSVDPMLRDLPFDEALAVARLFNDLEDTANVFRSPQTVGVYVGEWATIGTTARELARHMLRYDLKFAPGDPDANAAVHRALGGYYANLSQPPTGK